MGKGENGCAGRTPRIAESPLPRRWRRPRPPRPVPAGLIDQGAHRVIVGTAAFTPALQEIAEAVGPERVIVALDSGGRSKVVVKGWVEATSVHRRRSHPRPDGPLLHGGFLCTYVDKEGMLARHRPRAGSAACAMPRPIREITAAGRASPRSKTSASWQQWASTPLSAWRSTGRLDLAELASLNPSTAPRRKAGVYRLSC